MRILICTFTLFLFQACVSNSEAEQFQTNYRQFLAGLTQEEREKLQPMAALASLELETLAGEQITVGKQSDKSSIVILFATWCPACKAALPELAKAAEGWRDQVNIVAVGREHTAEELKNWQDTSGIQLPLVADPEKEIYEKFANRYIPRIYVMDKEGKVLYQEYGFEPKMISNIELALGL